MQDLVYPTGFYLGAQPTIGVGHKTKLQRNDVLWLNCETLKARITRQGGPIRAQLDSDLAKIREDWLIATEVLDPDQLAVRFARHYGGDVIPLGETEQGEIRWQFTFPRK